MSAGGAPDVGAKDQLPAMQPGSAKAASSAAPQISFTSSSSAAGSSTPSKGLKTPVAAVNSNKGVQFVYSLQGALGSQWVAKMPQAGEAGPCAYFSSTGSPVLLKDSFDDAPDVPLTSSRDLVGRS